MSEAPEFIIPDYLQSTRPIVIIKRDPDENHVDPIPGELVPEYYLTRGVDLDETINGEISSGCPANQDWEGPYKFGISFDNEETPKITSATYSEVLNKLYVTLGASSPILFHTATPPPFGAIIRASPVFLKLQHTSEVVKRCRLHADPTDQTNINCCEIVDHLVRCEAIQATYHCDPITERRSVTVPYCAPAEGMKHISFVFKFMCYNSCMGSAGVSKRSLQIIFTLEYKGEVIGRRVLNIRICAVPRRDRKREEEKAVGEKKTLVGRLWRLDDDDDDSGDESHNSSSKSNGYAKSAEPGNCSLDPGKRGRAAEDDQIYILRVRGKRNFKMLKYLNDLMQFHDAARNARAAEV